MNEGPFPVPVSPLDVEWAALTKLAVSDSIAPALKAGVDGSWFTDPACRRAWELQTEHAARHGRPATWELYAAHGLGMQQRFKPDDTLETLVEALRLSTASFRLKDVAARLQRELDLGEVPITEAWARASRGVVGHEIASLLSRDGTGGTLAGAWPAFEARAIQREQADGLIGVSWPWPTLDRATGGINPGDYVAFMGANKAGKSDAAIEVAVSTARDRCLPVLVVCNEMTFDDVIERVACRWAEVPYESYSAGRLGPRGWELLKWSRTATAESATLAVEHVAATGAAAVAQVRAHLERHRPALGVWDGHQLAAGSDEWEEGYALARRTRALALTTKTPILATVQLNPGRTGASYRAYHQDCTLAVKMEREGDWLHCSTPEVRNRRPVRW